METEEIWKDIEGFEGKYQVSNTGKVRSLNYLNTGKVRERKLWTNNKGYLMVGLGPRPNKHFLVHRLVAQAFLPNPQNLPCVNHKDRNPLNNNVKNLEYCTVAYNNKYSDVCGRGRKPVLQFTKDGRFIAQYESTRDAARETSLSQGNIYSCCIGRRNYTGNFTWKFKEDL